MRKYNGLNALWMSFYSGDFYRDVLNEWGGTGLLFLFVLTMGFIIVPSFPLLLMFNGYVERVIIPLVADFPTITVARGQLSIDKSEPFVLKDKDLGLVLCTVDPISEIPPTPGIDAGALVIGKTKILASGLVSGSVHQSDMPADLNMVMDRSTLKGCVSLVKYLGPVCLFLSYTTLLFICNSAVCLFYALMAVGFARLFQVNVPFFAGIRLSAVSMTPAYILAALIMILGKVSGTITLTGSELITTAGLACLTSLPFLLFAVLSCSRRTGGATQAAS